MHIRLTPFRFAVARQAELLLLAREHYLPLLRLLPGFRALLVAADRRRPGHGVLETRWDTLAQAEGARDALAPLAEQFRGLGVELGTARIYEVLLQE